MGSSAGTDIPFWWPVYSDLIVEYWTGGVISEGSLERAEVAIVGAGVVGLSVAFHLAEAGIDVVVLERRGVGAGASGVQPGGVRQQWTTRVNCDMARESVAFYAEVSERLGAATNPRLERCGYLFVAETEAELERLRAGVVLQNDCGVPSEVLNPQEAASVVPGLRTDALAGAAYCAEDGYVDKPQAVVEAFGLAAARGGARIVIGEVTRLGPSGGGWSLELADRTTLQAGQVVLAAGYDTPSLVAPLGLNLPIQREPRYLFFSNRINERLLEPLVVVPSMSFAAKQLADGRVLASDLSAAGDPSDGRKRWRVQIQRGIESVLPILEFVSFPLLVEGFYDMTPDHQPLLGEVDGFDGLWLAAGFSGHGFMMAPAVGRRLAAALAGEAPHPSLEELSLSRFERGELVRELQVV
jgi:sarcosine oxidase subunit beta